MRDEAMLIGTGKGRKTHRTRVGSVQPMRLPILVPVRKLARGCWYGPDALVPDRARKVVCCVKVAFFIRLDQELMHQHNVRLW
jgi:hypothetical protein